MEVSSETLAAIRNIFGICLPFHINEKFANLPAGNYKIYFRDFDPDIYDDQGRYWPQCNITDPISITVIDPNKKNDKATQNPFFYDNCHYNDEFYKSNGYVSVDKTIFRQGETIKFTNREYLASDAVRILLCEPNSNIIRDWIIVTALRQRLKETWRQQILPRVTTSYCSSMIET